MKAVVLAAAAAAALEEEHKQLQPYQLTFYNQNELICF
jgi:hypothetical protein